MSWCFLHKTGICCLAGSFAELLSMEVFENFRSKLGRNLRPTFWFRRTRGSNNGSNHSGAHFSGLLPPCGLPIVSLHPCRRLTETLSCRSHKYLHALRHCTSKRKYFTANWVLWNWRAPRRSFSKLLDRHQRVSGLLLDLIHKSLLERGRNRVVLSFREHPYSTFSSSKINSWSSLHHTPESLEHFLSAFDLA